MKRVPWAVLLNCNWCIFFYCLVHLLTPGGLLRRTTSVLSPAQQRTNCIAFARRLSFSLQWSVPVFLRVLLSCSAPLGMLVLSAKCISTVLHPFVRFVHTFCPFCAILLTCVFVRLRCATQTPYQNSIIACLCLCLSTTFHLTVRSPACLFSPIYHHPHSLYRDSLTLYTSVRRIAFLRKI